MRKDTAPLIVAFLNQAFKVEQQIVIKNQDLVRKLAEFLLQNEPLLYEDQESAIQKAKFYLEQWANEEILRQYPNELGENLNELTTYVDNPPNQDDFFVMETLHPKLDWAWERPLTTEPPLSERDFSNRLSVAKRGCRISHLL